MDQDLIRIIAVACAGLGVVSTAAHYVFKWKELRTLQEIRDKIGRK